MRSPPSSSLSRARRVRRGVGMPEYCFRDRWCGGRRQWPEIERLHLATRCESSSSEGVLAIPTSTLPSVGSQLLVQMSCLRHWRQDGRPRSATEFALCSASPRPAAPSTFCATSCRGPSSCATTSDGPDCLLNFACVPHRPSEVKGPPQKATASSADRSSGDGTARTVNGRPRQPSSSAYLDLISADPPW